MNRKIDYLLANETYEPRAPDMDKVKHYVNVSPTGVELKAHERDVYTPTPVTLKPPTQKRTSIGPDDVTDFPN